MSEEYKIDWKAPGFLQKLPQLLTPRILAEGYYLHFQDGGKQVFARQGNSRRTVWDFIIGPSADKLRRATVLTVSYILTPEETRVVFEWDNHLRLFSDEEFGRWIARQAKAFLTYLNDWWTATRQHTQQPDAQD